MTGGAARAGAVRRWCPAGAAPDAVLAHCSLAHAGAWEPVAARLIEKAADGPCLVAPDLPGHGARPVPAVVGDIQEDAVEILAEAAGKGPVDLIGHSFGATACLRLALERPELVRSLVLIEPVQFSLLREAEPALWQRHLADAMALRRRLEAGDREGATRAFYEKWGGGAPWSQLPAAQRRYMVDRVHLVAAAEPALMEDVGGIGAPGRLEGLRLPVLVLSGAESPAEIAGIASVLCRRLPESRASVIAGAGHMAPITHPDAVAAAIAEFREEVLRRRPQSRGSDRSPHPASTSR